MLNETTRRFFRHEELPTYGAQIAVTSQIEINVVRRIDDELLMRRSGDDRRENEFVALGSRDFVDHFDQSVDETRAIRTGSISVERPVLSEGVQIRIIVRQLSGQIRRAHLLVETEPNRTEMICLVATQNDRTIYRSTICASFRNENIVNRGATTRQNDDHSIAKRMRDVEKRFVQQLIVHVQRFETGRRKSRQTDEIPLRNSSVQLKTNEIRFEFVRLELQPMFVRWTKSNCFSLILSFATLKLKQTEEDRMNLRRRDSPQ